MSEPVYLAGTFLSVLIFLKYAATGKREWLVACGTVLGLTMIARFTTVPLIATLCIFLLLDRRSEEHTSELQSLMRISYAVFCLKKKNTLKTHHIQLNKTDDIYTNSMTHTQ